MEKENDQIQENGNSTPTSVTEGKATVHFPSALDVFYNPVQEFNRDLSIAVMRLYATERAHLRQKLNDVPKYKIREESFHNLEFELNTLPVGKLDESGLRVLEALSASGLRSLRYAQEIGGLKEITANDLSVSAVNCMKTNIESNNVGHIMKPSLSDASLLMYQHKDKAKQFDVIDLDPYGSPHIFLDSAVQALTDGGLLMVTSTDMGVLCGNAPETSFIKYGAVSMRHTACHELGLRILLQAIESAAIKYNRYIVPLLSLSVDFYARVFVRVFTSRLKCKESFTKMAYVHKCVGCESTDLQRLGQIVRDGNSVKYQLCSNLPPTSCIECNSRLTTAGPVWAEPIHDVRFVNRLKESLIKDDFNTFRRIEGMLTMAAHEVPSSPLYYSFDQIGRIMKSGAMRRVDFVSALLNKGYRVSQTHAAKNCIKTDAPKDVVWDLARTYRLKYGNAGKIPTDNIAQVMVSKEPKHSFDFTPHDDATFPETEGLLRFQINPEKNWGPKSRAKTSVNVDALQEKSRMNQGKKSKKRKIDEVIID